MQAPVAVPFAERIHEGFLGFSEITDRLLHLSGLFLGLLLTRFHLDQKLHAMLDQLMGRGQTAVDATCGWRPFVSFK